MGPTITVPVRAGLFVGGENGGAPALIASRCPGCARRYFPTRLVCPGCSRPDLEEVQLSGPGVLYSFATVRVAPPRFKAPYVVAYVDLPEGVRVFAPLTGLVDADRELRPGMAMELVIEPLFVDDAGREVVSYKFRPAGP